MPYCKELLAEIQDVQTELADILDEIGEFSAQERRRVESLPGAAEAYGQVILDLGIFVSTFTALGAMLRAVSGTARAARRVDRLSDAAHAADIVEELAGFEHFMQTYRDASAVRNSSKLRSLINAAKRSERRLQTLFDEWENTLCSVHFDP